MNTHPDRLSQPAEHIRKITPYQPGKPIKKLVRDMKLDPTAIIKLASNENPRGMSPQAKHAITDAVNDGNRYPDQYDLTHALAVHHQLPDDCIVLGNGSNDVLEMIARAYLGPGCSAVMSQYCFSVFQLATQCAGAFSIVTPALDYGCNLAAMVGAIREDTRVLWIANPNNPTGTFICSEELRHGLSSIPRRVLIVLDEAYIDYQSESDAYDAVRWLEEFPNLILTRSFSKIYGLAGLRIGYALCSADIAANLHRVRQPFNANTLALAGAQAALRDRVFVENSSRENRIVIRELTAGLSQLGLDWIPSYGNFVCIRSDKAEQICQHLLKEGIIVRPLAGLGMRGHIRVSVGLPQENQRFLKVLAGGL